MKDGRQFILFWIVNSFVLYFSPLLFNQLIVTGNSRLPSFMAGILSGFLLTVIIMLTEPFFKALKIKLSDEWQWLLTYLFINVLGVWLIARYADLTGVGISSAWVAVMLGVILNIGQRLTLELGKSPKSK